MEPIFKFNKPVDFKGSTLVIPSISVGNVPQLTADLLISTYNLKKVGSIWHSAVIPVLGSDPFDESSTEICTACEIYHCHTKKITVLQLRSSLYQKQALAFLKDLKTAFVLKNSFKQLVVLASGFSYEMHNLNSGPFRFITNKEDSMKFFKDMNLPEMEKINDNSYLIHGSAYAVKLYEILKEDLNCTVIIKYVSEGDNSSDAIQMIQVMDKYINNGADMYNIKIPYSWNLVFGNPPPLGIY